MRLVEKHIASAALIYLDSSPGVSWSASSSGSTAFAGCHLQRGLMLRDEKPPIQLKNVLSEQLCCHACWNEATCHHATYDSENGECFLGTGNMFKEFKVANHTTCRPKRTHQSTPIVINASVPGDLLTDLHSAGIIGDPLYELNFRNDSLWSFPNWTYATSISLPDMASDVLRDGGVLTLVFEGIKMGASISFNGHLLGTAVDQFLRYEFDVTAYVKNGEQKILVEFDPSIPVDGRFMACSGGWDWAPYSHKFNQGARTFSKGIWKSVYLTVTPRNAAQILHVVPRIHYSGEYPMTRLVDNEHAGFKIDVRIFMRTPMKTAGILTVAPEWGRVMAMNVSLPQGESQVNVSLQAASADVRLWWPVGLGQQHLYYLNVSFMPADLQFSSMYSTLVHNSRSLVSTSRRLGFRYFSLVTGNETDPDWLREATGRDGSGEHGLYFKVNGVPLYSRGANLIPMDELEGRINDAAYTRLVKSAVQGNFNTIRVWGGDFRS